MRGWKSLRNTKATPNDPYRLNFNIEIFRSVFLYIMAYIIKIRCILLDVSTRSIYYVYTWDEIL